jgi:hypothetical protein
LLDVLSASDDVDTNHDGVISMSELTAYIQKHLTELTDRRRSAAWARSAFSG